MDYPRRLRPAIVAASLIPAFAACKNDDAPGDGEDGASTTTGLATAADTGVDTTAAPYDCVPGDIQCGGDMTSLETCAPTGKSWIPAQCPNFAQCVECDPEDDANCDVKAQCLGPCEIEADIPSSAGCSFIVNRQLHLDATRPDGLVVANPDAEEVVQIWLNQTPEGTGTEEPLEGPILLDPLEYHVFELTTNFVQGNGSMYRSGGTYRLVSDAPVIAYHHAPLRMGTGNDSSMLLPESALKMDYVVASYSPHYEQGMGLGRPSYFEIVALENFTTVEWTPFYFALEGNNAPIPPAQPHETARLVMNRFDTARIAASDNDPRTETDDRDVSGTVVHADKNIWVVGASRCSRVPTRDPPKQGRCDPLQELMIPLNYWGTQYVAIASPDRCYVMTEDEGAPVVCDTERHYWRVYNGREQPTTVRFVEHVDDVQPPVTNDEFTIASRGEFFEFSVPHGKSFVLEGDGVFMPVQYLQSRYIDGELPLDEATYIGDPAMVQMVPTDEFLSRYVFVTALGFPLHYVQVIREQGNAEIFVDGEPIGVYEPVGDFTVATKEVTEGAHVVESADPFGIIQVGYSDFINYDCLSSSGVPEHCNSSYAYPGGMKSVEINIP